MRFIDYADGQFYLIATAKAPAWSPYYILTGQLEPLSGGTGTRRH